MTELQTFHLPDSVDDTESHVHMAYDMMHAWERDGAFQVAMTPGQSRKAYNAIDSGKRFFRLPMDVKSGRTSDLTYSGYAASETGESFTVCPDVALTDSRVQARWPCHGPVPWPDERYRRDLVAFLAELAAIGDKLLKFTALGLELADTASLTDLAKDGWHHLRSLRFPARSARAALDTGARTDDGLLVLAYQDDAGGLHVRPPVEGEKRNRNWLPGESTAGRYEKEEPWLFVRPVPNVLTAYPGDMMQFITDGALLATPHKVHLNTIEQFAIVYCHEPGFNACVHPLLDPTSTDYLHYGTHFTDIFMRANPDRSTTLRIRAEDRLAILDRLRQTATR